MKFRHIFFLILLLLCVKSGDAALFQSENDGAIALNDFYAGSNLWMPSQTMNSTGIRTVMTTIVRGLAWGGLTLAVCFMIAEGARIIMSGGELGIQEAFPFYGKAVLVCVVLALGVGDGEAFVKFCQSVFVVPIEAITDVIKTGSANAALTKIVDAMNAAAKANQESKLSWFVGILETNLSSLMTNFFMMFAMVIAWIISLYISIMTCMMVCLGPICLPFMLFQPVSSVAWNWIKSMIAYPMMGAVGAILMGMLMSSGMLNFSVTAGAANQNLTSIASSVILIICMVSVPGITNALFGGIMASPMAAARTLGGAMSTAASAATVATGAAMAASAPIAGAAGQMGVKAAGAATVGEDARLSTFRAASQGAAWYGEKAGGVGRAMMASQMPTFGRFKKELDKARGIGPGMGSLKSQQSSVIDYAAKTFGSKEAAALQRAFGTEGFAKAGVKALAGESKGQAVARTAGEMLRDIGARPTIASSISTADKKMGEDGFDFSFNSRAGNQKMMTEWVRDNIGKEEANTFATAVEAAGYDLKGTSKDVEAYVGDGALRAASELGLDIDYAEKMKGSPLAKQQDAIVAYVGRTHGPNMAKLVSGKLREDEFKESGLQLAGNRSYNEVMTATVGPLMEEMKLRVPTATSVDGAVKKAGRDGFDFNANTPAGNEAIMTDWVRKNVGGKAASQFAKDLEAHNIKESGKDPEDPTRNVLGITGTHGDVQKAVGDAVEVARQTLYPDPPAGGSGDGSGDPPKKEPTNWVNEIDSWDTEKHHKNMGGFLNGRYNDPKLTETFNQMLQTPEYKDLRIDTSKATGTKYDEVMGPFMYPLLEQMGIKPTIVSNMDELSKRKKSKNGWNFDANSRDGNNSIMTDYVRSIAGDGEVPRFQSLIQPGRNYLEGRHIDTTAAVADGVDKVYREAGEVPPERKDDKGDRSNYRGANKIPSHLEIEASTYKAMSLDERRNWYRSIMREANDGQYNQYADKVSIPRGWDPIPRDGQSFADAGLGAMKALLVRQGFIAKDPKDV